MFISGSEEFNLLTLRRKLVFCCHRKDLQILAILLGVAGLARVQALGNTTRRLETSGYLLGKSSDCFLDSGGDRLCGPVV